MDQLAAMRAFARTAETGSFSAAAHRLGLSKSMISRQISALEAELGVRLLQRTTRKLALTEGGQAYLDRCQRILSDVDEANQLVSHLQAVPRGKLRVNGPLSFGIQHLSPMLPRFLRSWPEIHMDMTMTDRFIDLVEEGYDVAVRIGKLPDSSLIVRRIAPIRRVVCATPEYFATHGKPEIPADLVHHQCLAHGGVEWRFITPDGTPFSVEAGGRFRADNGDVLRQMALAGVGLTYLPTFFVGDDLRNGRLVPVLETFIPQDTALHAVYPAARHLSPKVRAFVDFLAETFGPEPYWDCGTGTEPK